MLRSVPRASAGGKREGEEGEELLELHGSFRGLAAILILRQGRFAAKRFAHT